jgi:hypothetical protein
LIDKLAEELQNDGEEAFALSVDLCDENAIQAAFDLISKSTVKLIFSSIMLAQIRLNQSKNYRLKIGTGSCQ